MKVFGYIIVLIAFTCSCSDSKVNDKSTEQHLGAALDATKFEDVSMISLIANPDKYHGRRVIVSGFVHLEFEGNMIFLSENDFKHNLNKNALCLYLSREQVNSPMLQKCQNKYAFVKGTFDMNALGHNEVNSGGINDIVLADTLIDYNTLLLNKSLPKR